MKSRFLIIAAALSAAFLSGCHFIDRHFLDVSSLENQAVEVEIGDRFYFELDENLTTGYMWDYVCGDNDLEVTIEHTNKDANSGMTGVGGKAEVRVRVKQGFRGPSSVVFNYARPWEKKKAIKSFQILFFFRGVDCSLFR